MIADCALEGIIAARLDGDLVRLSALTVGRVYVHHLATRTGSFALLTAWRDGGGPEINRRNSRRLQQQFRAAQIGFGRLIARWTKGDFTYAIEPWLWVHGVRLETAVKLASKYGQDAIGFSGRETAGAFEILKLDAEAGAVTNVERFHQFDPIAVAAWYSERGLVFDHVAQGWFEGVWLGRVKRDTDQRAS